jgi:hypothetical protein
MPPVSTDNEISAPEASTTIPPRQRESQTARFIGPDSSPDRDGRSSAAFPTDRRATGCPLASAATLRGQLTSPRQQTMCPQLGVDPTSLFSL